MASNFNTAGNSKGTVVGQAVDVSRSKIVIKTDKDEEIVLVPRYGDNKLIYDYVQKGNRYEVDYFTGGNNTIIEAIEQLNED